MNTDFETAFQNEPVTFLLSNALRHLTQDQQRQLCNALLERLPVPASIEQEAERLYPYFLAKNYPHLTDYEIRIKNTNVDSERSAHITCARQYMGEMDRLKAENSKMRRALEEMRNHPMTAHYVRERIDEALKPGTLPE